MYNYGGCRSVLSYINKIASIIQFTTTHNVLTHLEFSELLLKPLQHSVEAFRGSRTGA